MKTHKKIRHEAAVTRQQAHAKLTVSDKLAKLDAKLGIGLGAKKERARLQKQLETTTKS